MADLIGRAISDAERGAFTRPIPKTPQAQLNFLLKHAKDSTRELAKILGVSPRQALRYRKGEARLPSAKLQKAVEQRWQPRNRAKARERAAQRGIQVEIRARFGFAAAGGSTDDARMRRLTQTLPPDASARLLAASTETERQQALAEGLGHAYFRDRGSRATGLNVELTDIDHIDMTL
ncbi:XRE family transcriptional regulator [Streptomyces sp. NPDC052000]|uniref:telomere-protecting terminal protein Tpg n=1 Tax=Streptomyces sp. NPDC052000 TaxID=3155676 RepID=UPI00344C872C